MKDNTKTVGDVAEIVAAAELIKSGYVVSRPLSDNAPYDLIYDTGKQLRRAQVKGRTSIDGKITVELYCNARSYKGKYDQEDFDDIIIVDLNTYAVAVVDVRAEQLFETDARYKSFALRTEKPLNNQTKGVRMFDDYRIIPS